jgi:hypothetical protein
MIPLPSQGAPVDPVADQLLSQNLSLVRIVVNALTKLNLSKFIDVIPMEKETDHHL